MLESCHLRVTLSRSVPSSISGVGEGGRHEHFHHPPALTRLSEFLLAMMDIINLGENLPYCCWCQVKLRREDWLHTWQGMLGRMLTSPGSPLPLAMMSQVGIILISTRSARNEGNRYEALDYGG